MMAQESEVNRGNEDLQLSQSENQSNAQLETENKPVTHSDDVTLNRQQLEQKERAGSIDMYEKEKLQQMRQNDSPEQRQKLGEEQQQQQSVRESPEQNANLVDNQD